MPQPMGFIGHKNPDEDCIASLVGFSLLLSKMSKQPQIVLDVAHSEREAAAEKGHQPPKVTSAQNTPAVLRAPPQILHGGGCLQHSPAQDHGRRGSR